MDNNYTLINENALYDTKFSNTKEIRSYLNSPNFRSFSIGLTELLRKSGYTGSDSPDEKIDYLHGKLQAISSGLTKELLLQWFQNDEKRPVVKNDSRKGMYEICFALNLPLEDVNWFFSHVYYDRSFNCHSLDEAVYYFCFKNSLSYAEAKEIIRTVESQEAPASFFENSYTSLIVGQLDSFDTKEELITYLVQNKATFEEGHWNQSALHHIELLRTELKGSESSEEKEIVAAIKQAKCVSNSEITKCGLLLQELYHYYQDYQGNAATPEQSLKQELTNAQVYSDSFLLSKILCIKNTGLPKSVELPAIVKQNFPRKADFCSILKNSGSLKSYDSIRKTLILLKFYSFWCHAKLAADKSGSYYLDISSDVFEDETNDLLRACGYAELTACNPYDWLYLVSAQQDDPLDTFREFLGDIVAKDNSL